MDEKMGEWMDESIDNNGQLQAVIDEWMDGRVSGNMDG